MNFETAKRWLKLHDIEIDESEHGLISVTWNNQVAYIESRFLEPLVQIVGFVHTNSYHNGYDMANSPLVARNRQ